MSKTITWTPSHVKLLVELWCVKGLGSAAVAAKLQIAFGEDGINRNMVLGKVHRLRLKRAIPVRLHTKSANRGNFPGRDKKPYSPPGVFRDIELDGYDVLRATLNRHVKPRDLEDKHCRWPYGDAKTEDFHFCGEKRAPGRSYCPHHLGRAYRPS